MHEETSESVAFLLYCIEMYKLKHNINGTEAHSIFAKNNINTFILDNFGALHTTGIEYVLEEIEEMISKETNETIPRK